MASILIHHSVKNFDAWKIVFDAGLKLRTSNGELSAQVYRDVSDPNKLTVINQWDSMANAQKFAISPELKVAMEQAGVVGTPTVYFLNEA